MYTYYPVLEHMIASGIDLTIENYMALAHDGENVEGELAASLPPILRESAMTHDLSLQQALISDSAPVLN